MNLALRKIIYDPISYIHPQRVSLNNTPINMIRCLDLLPMK